MKKHVLTLLFGLVLLLGAAARLTAAPSSPWPELQREHRPWTYWWWMASAVDRTNITRELTRYQQAGLGGVHIIPIYGAKGWESNALPYLGPEWMTMLRHTLNEAKRLGLDVDMTTGSGWCFGGPRVSDQDANASVVPTTAQVKGGATVPATFGRGTQQAVVAFGPDGQTTNLLALQRAGQLAAWTAPAGDWQVYAVSQKPSGQKVKRAAPGGQGHMLNLFHPAAMDRYLEWFEEAFKGGDWSDLRAMYHDSYEYRNDWSPALFEEFARRRGYRLEQELPALFNRQPDERSARVKCDYRETISDIQVEQTLARWVAWSRQHGWLTRNEAHGSPANLLDLYALVDSPETEMFHQDRNPLICKFASSASHVAGRRFVSNETGTWLREHFQETLGDVKLLLDDLFVAGVNHVFYHGTCYSPDEAGWPGWLFYAATQMNPRNAIWRDVPAINAYIARCQSLLQAGRADNDLLVYWPIYDTWQKPEGMVQPMTVHSRGWFEGMPMGRVAGELWNRGFTFDYLSDRQLATVRQEAGALTVPGGRYEAVLVPRCQFLPVSTLRQMLALAENGASILFVEALPGDVPGQGNLTERRREFQSLLGRLKLARADGCQQARMGRGRVFVGELEAVLAAAGIRRETMVDQPGVRFIRRTVENGAVYFVANRSNRLETAVTFNRSGQVAVLMDPWTGRAGTVPVTASKAGSRVRLSLEPGQSLFIRLLAAAPAALPTWDDSAPAGKELPLTGNWRVTPVAGGPVLPPAFTVNSPGSWTAQGGDWERFGGTARYRLAFAAPAAVRGACWVDLGAVGQSARVYLNGADLGTVVLPPFRVRAERLLPGENVLEVEVTNLSANRIRDLDRRQIVWRNFHDINLVNIDYKPFNAADWPVFASGLLGPVTLQPLQP
jgi:hypothetical protein